MAWCLGHFQQAVLCVQECGGRIFPPLPPTFPGVWTPAAGQLAGLGFPMLSKHAGGGWLHNSFPISCALQGLLEVLAAKCNMSPLSPIPAAQPAYMQPAAFPACPASGCSTHQQPSFPHWVSPGLFLPFSGFILPSPSSGKDPYVFALSHRAIHAVPCRQVPACCSGEIDKLNSVCQTQALRRYSFIPHQNKGCQDLD